MYSSRHKTALSTAFLTVMALMVTVPFEAVILTDVTPATSIAQR